MIWHIRERSVEEVKMGQDTLQTFLEKVEEKFIPIVTAIDDILSKEESLQSAIKWNQWVYAAGGDYHHWICALTTTKKAVCLRFHFGGLMSDPDKVFRTGTSKFLRTIDYGSFEQVDPAQLTAYLQEALSRLDYFKAHWKELQ